MIWRSTTALLCSDHRCEQEWNKSRLKHTFRPVPAFDGFRFSVVRHEVRVQGKALPPHPLLQGPSGVPAPAPLLIPGWPLLPGVTVGLPSVATHSRLRAEAGGDGHPAGARGSSSGPRAAGRERGARDGLSPLNPWRPRPSAWQILESASLHTRTHPQGRVQGGRADPHAPPCPHSRRHLPAAA